MNQMRFWIICSDIFLRTMICKSDLNGTRMISPFGITEALSIRLRMRPARIH